MEDRSFLNILTCAHGAHFWAPSTSPQNWGHLSWWGRSKRPHSNLGRCRCVLFGTGSHTAIPSANKAYLDALSSVTKLVTQVGNHTQTVSIRFQLASFWGGLRSHVSIRSQGDFKLKPPLEFRRWCHGNLPPPISQCQCLFRLYIS